MLMRSLVAAGLLLAMSASGVAAEPGKGQGNGNGHGKQQAASSSSSVSSQFVSGSAADGTTDPNVVVLRPGATGTTAAVVCSNEPDAWAKALKNSDWISLTADCTTALEAGNFRYDTTFNVPSGTTGLSLSGSAMSDDNLVSVMLNGHALTLSGAGGFSSPGTFSTSDQTFFVAGTNTLSITVNNASGATGLDFQARLRSDNESDADNGNGGGNARDNHGACVAAVAHSTPPGPGHGEAVSEAAHNCA
jgi:hypothetical protein